MIATSCHAEVVRLKRTRLMAEPILKLQDADADQLSQSVPTQTVLRKLISMMVVVPAFAECQHAPPQLLQESSGRESGCPIDA